MRLQLQDAYIVAATRTPIGKAPRGMFRYTRPDDLLVAAIRGAMAAVPNLDPALIIDADAFASNLATMAAAHPGGRLRPHVKAHKTTAIARRQAELGHSSFTCATLATTAPVPACSSAAVIPRTSSPGRGAARPRSHAERTTWAGAAAPSRPRS